MSTDKTFNPAKAYARQEVVYFDDGREDQLLEYVMSRADMEDMRGSPEKILAAIDVFGTQRYLMNVGKDKGEIVTRLIATSNPRVMVELGGYVGYSAILFADAVRAAGGDGYFCLEHNAEFAAIIRKLVEVAGLGNFVTILIGNSSDSLRRLKAQGTITQIDVLFLDHQKSLYLSDLQLCEEIGLIKPGTSIAADNVIKPGNPPYLHYVRSSVEEKRQGYHSAQAAPVRTSNATQGGGEKEGSYVNERGGGDPNLIYKSEIAQSFEPTGIPDGIEITRCIGQTVAC